MKWSIHQDADVTKNPQDGRVTISHAGHSSSFTPDEIKALPSSEVYTDPSNGSVTVTSEQGQHHFSRHHFAALFRDEDAESAEEAPTEEQGELITDRGSKSAEELAAESAANRDEANSLLGASPKQDTIKEQDVHVSPVENATVETNADAPPQE